MHHFNVLLEASYHGWATYPPMYPLQKYSFNSRPLIKGNQWVFISPDHKAGYVLLAVGRYFWRGIRRARLESPFITWREPTLRISPRGTRTNGFGWMVKRMNLGWPVKKKPSKITLLRVIPTMTCWVEVVRWGLSLRIWWEEWRIWEHCFQVSLA